MATPGSSFAGAESLWQNKFLAEDVNSDCFVSPSDALLLINDINANGSRSLPAERLKGASFLDVSGDNKFSPLDVLIVINFLNNDTVVPSQTGLLAYDGFAADTQSSILRGSGGGCGFADVWTSGGFNASVHDNFEIATDSLAFPDLVTSGGSVTTPAQAAISGLVRELNHVLATGETFYLSFAIQPRDTLDAGALNGFFGIYLDSQQPNFPNDLFVGKPGNDVLDRYVIEHRGGALQIASNLPVNVNETAFLVLKVELLEGNDRFTLYTNPVPGDPEPSSGTVKEDFDLHQVAAIVIYATGSFGIDELRVGRTYAAVTPAS